MQLTVLGCYGPYPPAGGSCSGYLLQHEGTAVLLDCGNGVLSRLRYHLEPWQLDAVILSHLHSDHISDVMILRYAVMIHHAGGGKAPLPVYAPEEPAEEFARLSYKEYLRAQAITAETSLQIGGIQFHFARGKHPYPSYFIAATAAGKKLVYSGDSADFAGMAHIIRGADVFLCEANYSREDLSGGGEYHMAAFQAARAAREAGVRRLVLTHHHPERDPQQNLAEAREIFPAAEIARPGSVYHLADKS
jgi:ribonuclease BN (tRNA processing enzyme)